MKQYKKGISKQASDILIIQPTLKNQNIKNDNVKIA